MSGLRYEHPVNPSLYHILVSLLNLEIDFNAVFIPVGINVIFVDLKLHNGTLLLDDLLMEQHNEKTGDESASGSVNPFRLKSMINQVLTTS